MVAFFNVRGWVLGKCLPFLLSFMHFSSILNSHVSLARHEGEQAISLFIRKLDTDAKECYRGVRVILLSNQKSKCSLRVFFILISMINIFWKICQESRVEKTRWKSANAHSFYGVSLNKEWEQNYWAYEFAIDFLQKKNSTVHYLHRLVGYFHDRQRKTKYPFKRSLTALTLDNSTKWYPLLYKRIFSFELEKNNSMSKMKLAQSGSRQAKSTTEEAAIALVWMAFQQSAIF